ncbi:MAG: RDD family protein [Candidatus Binatia bacterium]
MKCPSCGSIISEVADRCDLCGASVSREEASSGMELEFTVGNERRESGAISNGTKDKVDLGHVLDQEVDRYLEAFQDSEEEIEKEERVVQWGGFFRRTCAFFVDLLMLGLFSFFLFYVVYVGYSVGLAAHDQRLSLNQFVGLLRILIPAWLLLVSGYFVLFHGMEGKTVGKWLLGLRVIGVNQEPITYGQALVRWLGTILCTAVGAGFFWILWNQERRGWHDLLARTWVIREPSSTPSTG